MVNAARRAIERTYTGICTVTEYGSVKDPKSKLTRQQEVITAENIPCRVSFESIRAAEETDRGAAVAQSIKLFVSPETEIKSGCKITVEQYGKKTDYAASGVPAVYPTHQEIMLELFRGWA